MNRYLLASLLVVSSMFLRPSLLGYWSSMMGLLIISIVLSIRFSLMSFCFKRDAVFVFVINIGFLFLYFLALINIDLKIAFKTLAISGSFVVVIFLLQSYLAEIADVYKKIMFFIILSGLVTISLIDYKDVYGSLSGLEVLEVPVKDRGQEVLTVYFPLTPIIGTYYTELFPLPRLTFFAIEPGVAVAYLAAWYALTKRIRLKFATDLIYILSNIATASTLAVPYALYHVMARRGLIKRGNIFLSLLLILFVAIIFLYFPYFGVLGKLATHGSSIEDRVIGLTSDDPESRVRVLVIVLVFFHYYFLRFFRLIIPVTPLFVGILIVAASNVIAFSPVYYLFLSVHVNGIFKKS